MILIVPEHTDVYRHLAAEDYLLHHSDEDVLMLWRSQNAVVCGKHQNLCAEANYGYCATNGIALARRLTGGGTVFHDLGNINFTFIKTINEGLEYAIDYKRFLEPIRQALLSLGIETTYSDRNDLLMNGKKISGNAEHVLQNKRRVLHHGTLLYDSNLKALGKALHAEGIYTDKAVKSVRSEVTNIRDGSNGSNPEQFILLIAEYFSKNIHTNRYVLNSMEESQIAKIRADKYASQDWILGYSPRYMAQKMAEAKNEKYIVQFEVVKGIIEGLDVFVNDQKNPFPVSDYQGKKLSIETCQELALELQLNDPINPYLLF